MNIIVCNNPNKRVYSEAYDKVIYLGYTPDKDLEVNEVIILGNLDSIIIENYRISTKGICIGSRLPKDKWDLVEKHIGNQIVLNDNKSNIYDERPNGNKLYFIGLGNHYEIEI